MEAKSSYGVLFPLLIQNVMAYKLLRFLVSNKTNPMKTGTSFSKAATHSPSHSF